MRSSALLPLIMMPALIVVTPGAPSPVAAWSGCGSSYLVQWGDTLGPVAGMCGTSVSAPRLANPGLGYWLYAGQALWMPGAHAAGSEGHDECYVARGDTLKKVTARLDTTVEAIAVARFSVSLQDLITANPQNTSPNRIYNGQVVYLPGYASLYTAQHGDTLKKITAISGTTALSLTALNPQIWDATLIYPGQIIRLW